LNAAAPRGAGPRRTAWQVQRSVLFALVIREMMARVGGQWIGAIWTLVEPLAHTIMLVAWLGLLRSQELPGIDYPVFLATGLVPFFFFQKLVTRSLDAIDGNRGLFTYRQVKPIDPLLARALVEALMNLIVYGVTMAILGMAGFGVAPDRPLELLAVNLLIALFGLAFGIFATVVSHDRPRLRTFVRLIFFPLYLASGVVLSVDRLSSSITDWLLLNPLLHLVELSRHAFISEYRPLAGVNAFYPTAWLLAVAALGLALYRANRLRLLTTSI
jgi:capsular polysaccharide transport system permease protein